MSGRVVREQTALIVECNLGGNQKHNHVLHFSYLPKNLPRGLNLEERSTSVDEDMMEFEEPGL